MSMQHYEGDIGKFDYDDSLWEICDLDTEAYLHWKGGLDNPCAVPDGVKSFKYMFRDCELGKKNVISNIGCMCKMLGCSSYWVLNGTKFDFMFLNSKLQEGFILPREFHSGESEPISIEGMFYNCEIYEKSAFPEGFGDMVLRSTKYMFAGCQFTSGFKLPTSLKMLCVEDASLMFSGCKFPTGFQFSDSFDTKNVTDMSNMFSGCTFNDGFSFGRGFSTESVRNFSRMFECAHMNDDFSLGDKFTFRNARRVDRMFQGAYMPESLVIPDYNVFSKVPGAFHAFDGCRSYRSVRGDASNYFRTKEADE